MIGYYDIVLGAVPVTLLGVAGALYGAGVDLFVAVPLAAGLAALVIGHGLFVNAPVSDDVEVGAAEPAPEPPALAAD